MCVCMYDFSFFFFAVDEKNFEIDRRESQVCRKQSQRGMNMVTSQLAIKQRICADAVIEHPQQNFSHTSNENHTMLLRLIRNIIEDVRHSQAYEFVV